MKPFKIRLKVDASDHYVYKGRLYIVMSDGGIVMVSINEIIDKLIDRYPQYLPLIQLGFCRNNFWNSDAAKCFLSIHKVRKSLMSEWNDAAEKMIFELSLKDLQTTTITKEIESEVLSIDIYADRLFLGCRKGFYSNILPEIGQKPASPKKRFDAKIYSVNAGYGNVILSLGKDGLIPTDVNSEDSVDEKRVNNSKSMQSRWTAAGGLMNYADKRSFEFFGNLIDKNNDFIEKYFVKQFAVKKYDLERLLSNQRIINSDQILLCFNNRATQYIVDSDKSILASKINVSKGEITRLVPDKLEGTPNNKYLGKLISGDTIANHLALEYEEGLVLIDGNDKRIIEDDAIVNFHTYPRSKYFRDILTVTTEESINIHAVDVFDMDPNAIFPNADMNLNRKR